MGFKSTDEVDITFPPGHPFAEAVLVARSIPLGDYGRLSGLAAKLDGADGAVELTDAQQAALEQIAAEFAAALVEWNTEHRRTGEPLEPTKANFDRQSGAFRLAVTMAWLDTMSDVDPGLGKGSPNGARSAVDLDLPTEVLSPSRGS